MSYDQFTRYECQRGKGVPVATYSVRGLGLIQEDEYMVSRRYFGAKKETRIVIRRQAGWTR